MINKQENTSSPRRISKKLRSCLRRRKIKQYFERRAERPLKNLKEVTECLTDFLRKQESENIILTGAWGSGKTEVWKRAVAPIQKKSFRYNTGLWVAFFCIILLPIINIIIPLYPNILSFLQTYKYPFSILYILFSLLSLGAFYYCLNRKDKLFARIKYAYVSAGDCETLKDLKEKIIFSTLMSWEAGKALTPVKVFIRDALRPGFWTGVFLGIVCLLCYLFKDEVSDYFLAYWKLILPAPIIAVIVGSFFNFFRDHRRYYLERNAIICIDDIERAKKLDPQDILHLASDLRDNRTCKVALILNPDQFPAESKEEVKRKSVAFQKVLEKGSDRHLLLELSPQEAAYLAFTDQNGKKIKDKNDSLVKALRKEVIDLKISNVRIIKRIWSDLKRWEDYLIEISEKSLKKLDFEFPMTVTASKDNCSEALSMEALWQCLADHTVVIGSIFYNLPDGIEKLSYEALKGRFNESLFAWEAISQICFENIKKGLLNKEKAQKALKKYADDTFAYWKSMEEKGYTSQQIEIIEKPKKLAKKKRNCSQEIKAALNLIPSKEETIDQIFVAKGFRGDYLHYLLCLAEMKNINETKWANDFRELCKSYIEKPEHRCAFPDYIWPSIPCIDTKLKEFCINFEVNRREKEKEFFERNKIEQREKVALEKCLMAVADYLSPFSAFLEFKCDYQGWDKESLQKILDENTEDYPISRLIKIINAFWSVRTLTDNTAGVSEMFGYLRENKDSVSQERIVYARFGKVLHEALNDYLNQGVFSDPELAFVLSDEKHPWKELIKYSIHSNEEINKEAETS